MVHAYTASGLLVAIWIATILMQPEVSPNDVRQIFLLMLLATFIDATDGTFARMVRIKETIPSFDGRRLDDLTDFLTYACLPMWLIYKAALLPNGFEWLILVIMMASAYGFCQTNIKTPDGSFVGFPSYWNIVAFYLYISPINEVAAVLMVAGFAILTFVPSRYSYPTQPGFMNRMMLILSVFWAILLTVAMWNPWEHRPPFGASAFTLSLWIYPAFYMLMAWGMSLNRVLKKK
jgi:phosphatidylcholine synthase